jgi:hypothetical protein
MSIDRRALAAPCALALLAATLTMVVGASPAPDHVAVPDLRTETVLRLDEPATHGSATDARGSRTDGGDGTLPPADEPLGSARAHLELVGNHDLGGNGFNADVWLHRGVAYVGSWGMRGSRPDGCPGTGVRVVDLADPTRPELAAALAEYPRTTAEVVRVRAVETPDFHGDLLAVGLQGCGGEGLRGVDLWDVTSPRHPERLGFFDVGPRTGGVHELDLVQRADGRVLALLAVPFSEDSHPERLGDFRIVDVSDPRAPQALGAWGARAALGLGSRDGQGTDQLIYGHSARASADGMRAYVSYWDAGVVILDLTNPATPRLIGRTTFGPDDEGNAHSVDLAQDGGILIEADEVFTIERQALHVNSPADLAGPVPAGGTLPAPPWHDTHTVTGELVYLGRGCPAGDWTGSPSVQGRRLAADDAYLQPPEGRIALLERGGCPFAAKLERAKTAGALGAVLISSENASLTPMGTQGPLGAFGISRRAGERLKTALASGRSVQVTLDAELHGYQDFGGLRLWNLADPTHPHPIGTFHTPRSRVDPLGGASAPGNFSAHNPVVQGDLLYASWYSDGVRVVDIHDPAVPRELTAWTLPAIDPSKATDSSVGREPQIWGVAVEGGLIVASAIGRGLYVLRLVH